MQRPHPYAASAFFYLILRLSYLLFVFRKRISAAYLSSTVSAFSANSRLSAAAVRNLASISGRWFLEKLYPFFIIVKIKKFQDQ